jgi:TonB family protein
MPTSKCTPTSKCIKFTPKPAEHPPLIDLAAPVGQLAKPRGLTEGSYRHYGCNVTPQANAWLLRGSAVGAILLIHGAIFYSMQSTRAVQDAGSASVPMFSAIRIEHGKTSGGILEKDREFSDQPSVEQTAPDSRWKFPPLDVWPTDSRNAPRITELSSASGAEAFSRERDAPDPRLTSNRRSKVRTNLGILRWVRPMYPTEWAEAGKEGSVVLNVHIDNRGQPIEVGIARGSGTAELDESALAAVHNWTFTPPLQNSWPVSVWAEVELRFNR